MKSSLCGSNSWFSYRLADVVKGQLRKHEPHILDHITSSYPDTIASRYINMTEHLPEEERDMNLQVLNSLVDDTPSDEINMHVRAHDVIDSYKNGKYIYNFTWCRFQPDQLVTEHVVNHLLQNEFKTVNIFCARHHELDQQTELSQQLIDDCVDVLEQHDINSTFVDEPDPDVAFTRLCNSHVMIGTQLGYSHLACNMVKHRKRVVFDLTGLKQ